MESEQLSNSIERLIAVMSNRMPAQPFAAGGMGFMNGGGMAPFRGQEDYNTNRSYASMQMMQTITEHDFRTRALANVVQGSVYGRTGINPDSSFYKTTQAVGGLMFNNPALASITGGSALDMGFGIQNMIYQSGLRANGQRIYGGGAVTDAAAVNLFDRMQDNFFDSKRGGLAKLDKTFGADRTELGQIFSALGQRGAFAGMDIGNISTYGGNSVQVGGADALTQKISSMTSEAAKTLRIVKDILGDLGMQELMRVTESLTGGSFSNTRDTTAMQRSIMGTLIQGQALDIDPRQVLELRKSSAEGMMAQGFGGREAGSASGAMFPVIARNFVSQQEYAKLAGDKGYHVDQRSITEITAAAAGQQGAMMNSPLFQAYAVAKTMIAEGQIDDPVLAKLVSKANPTDSDMREIQRRTNAKIGAGGVSQYLEDSGGMKNFLEHGMGETTRTAVNLAARNVLNQRSLTTYTTSMLSQRSVMLEGNSGLKNAGDIIKNLTWMNATLTLKGQEDIQSAMEKGDYAAVRDILTKDKAGLSPEEVEEHTKALIGISSGFKNNYAILRGVRNADPNRATNQSIGERVAHNESELNALNYFSDMSVNGTTIDKLIRGFIGEKTVTEGEIFKYLELRDKARPGSYNGFSSTSTSDEAGMTKLMKDSGMSDDEIKSTLTDLKDPKKRAEVLKALMPKLSSGGAIAGVRRNEDGSYTVGVASAKGATYYKDKIEQANRKMAEDELILGRDTSKEKNRNKSTFEDALHGELDMSDETRQKYEEKLDSEIVRLAESKDATDQERFKDYLKTAGNRGLTAIQAREEQLKNERDGIKGNSVTDKKNREDKQAEIEKLEAAKRTAADRFMGYLEIADPSKLVFAISQMLTNGAAPK